MRNETREVWTLGKHRLICGDCTDKATVRMLMKSDLAAMVFTDPPYGVRYTGHAKSRAMMHGDDLDAVGIRRLVSSSLRAAPLRPGGAFYVCSSSGPTETFFRQGIADSDLRLRQCLVWAKQHFVIGGHDYHLKHESILYGWRSGATHYFGGGRAQHSLWEFPRPTKSLLHPTMKPVDLIEKAIRNSSLPGEIVFDGFGGSGSTLIACERSGRRCRMAEIDPEYCKVIVRRWETETGRRAYVRRATDAYRFAG
jgi:DNA modification methylase